MVCFRDPRQGDKTADSVKIKLPSSSLTGSLNVYLKDMEKKAGGCFPKESYGNNMRKGCTLGGSLKIPLKLYTVIEK